MPVVLKLFMVLLVAPVVYMLLPVILNRTRRIKFYLLVAVHVIALSFASLSVLNFPETILSDQISFLGFKQRITSKEAKTAYNFITNNFILIDNSFDKELIPNMNETQGDSTYLSITNRRKLTTFFNALANDSENVDLVVCDIGFDDITPYDSLLRISMSRLHQQNKLLVSVAGQQGQNDQLNFPEAISGDVKEATNEKLFTSHRLKREKFYSLPYQVYAMLNGIQSQHTDCLGLFLEEKTMSGNTHWKMNTFLPQFYITDESLLDQGFAELKANNTMQEEVPSVLPTTILIRTLGNSISEYGQEDLLIDLKARKQRLRKNIVLVGAFHGNEDLHKTAYAELHGPTILLNLIYSLEQKQNKISIALVLLLLVFFFLITLVLFNRILEKVNRNDLSKDPKTKESFKPLKQKFSFKSPFKKFRSSFILSENIKNNSGVKFFLLLIDFIFIEELHYFLLLLMVFALYAFLGVLINGISLAFYLIAFETFAVYFGKVK